MIGAVVHSKIVFQLPSVNSLINLPGFTLGTSFYYSFDDTATMYATYSIHTVFD